MKMRSWLELALVFVFLVAVLIAIDMKGRALAATKWEGVYRIEGVNPDGKPYTGAAEIMRARVPTLYQIIWRVAGDGGDSMAFGFEHDGQLHATGLTMPLAFVLSRNLEARWALPTADFQVLGREKFKRADAKSLDEVQVPAPAVPARALPNPTIRALAEDLAALQRITER